MPRPRMLYHVLDANGRLRYVGVSVDPAIRFMQHVTGSTGQNRFHNWLQDAMQKRRKPKMVVVRKLGDNWKEDEQREIRKQYKAGHALLNGTVRGAPKDIEDRARFFQRGKFRIGEYVTFRHQARSGWTAPVDIPAVVMGMSAGGFIVIGKKATGIVAQRVVDESKMRRAKGSIPWWLYEIRRTLRGRGTHSIEMISAIAEGRMRVGCDGECGNSVRIEMSPRAEPYGYEELLDIARSDGWECSVEHRCPTCQRKRTFSLSPPALKGTP